MAYFFEKLTPAEPGRPGQADLIRSPAAQQLLWAWVPDAKYSGEVATASRLRTEFVRELADLDNFPRRPRLLGVANGRGTGRPPPPRPLRPTTTPDDHETPAAIRGHTTPNAHTTAGAGTQPGHRPRPHRPRPARAPARHLPAPQAHAGTTAVGRTLQRSPGPAAAVQRSTVHNVPRTTRRPSRSRHDGRRGAPWRGKGAVETVPPGPNPARARKGSVRRTGVQIFPEKVSHWARSPLR
ncbi:hypothetical protein ABZX88_05235 [Kitasatospora aureofaciens]|uniref:hypothetical protein n=1 Tax=Kitasatospora aureofaciens TaxID=1894 RepID=UPI0033B6DA8B